MGKKPVDVKATAGRTRYHLAAELVLRGGRCVEEATTLNRRVLKVTNRQGHRLTLIPKGRTSGTWQGSTNDGDPSKSEDRTFWVFADFEVGDLPEYYIVPDKWMRQNIAVDHAEYFESHGGKRAITADSTHPAIELWRIVSWADRWDLLDL